MQSISISIKAKRGEANGISRKGKEKLLGLGLLGKRGGEWWYPIFSPMSILAAAAASLTAAEANHNMECFPSDSSRDKVRGRRGCVNTSPVKGCACVSCGG